MDPTELAGRAVALVLPMLGPLAEKVGAGVAEGAAARLYQALKRRLSPGTYAGAQLTGVEEHPERQARQQALAGALVEVLAEDPAFAAEVERLVAEADAAAGHGVRIHVEGPMAIGGDVRLEGHNVAGHDLVIGSEAPPEPHPDRPPRS